MRRYGELPDLLTVEEAAALLRVGRTKAYAMAKEWRATEGRSGLPVLDFGNVLRVPRCRLEAMVGGELRATASRTGRADGAEPSGDSDGSGPETPGGTAVVEVEAAQEASGAREARPGGDERRRRRRSGPGAAQLSLLHPPSTPDPTTHLTTPPSHPPSTNSTTLP